MTESKGRLDALSSDWRHGLQPHHLEESSDLSGSEEDTTWISWFCNLRGNEYFVEVSEEDHARARLVCSEYLPKPAAIMNPADALLFPLGG